MSAVRPGQQARSRAPTPRMRVSKHRDPIAPETYLEMYEHILRVRYMEEQLGAFVRANRCTAYASCHGREKLQIAIAMVLEKGKDWLFPYERDMALAVSLGMQPKEIFLHMLSCKGDPCGEGRNVTGSFSSKDLRIVSPTACAGAQFLPAVGVAKAVRMDGRDEIVLVSSGIETTGGGEFFEAMSRASREHLPVLFVVQNDRLAMEGQDRLAMDVHDRTAMDRPQGLPTRLTAVAESLGIRAYAFDGTRFTQMYMTLQPIIANLRKGNGPVLIEAHVPRLHPHSSFRHETDHHGTGAHETHEVHEARETRKARRTKRDLEEARRKDPLAHTEAELVKRRVVTTEDVRTYRERIKAEVDRAAEEAVGTGPPDTAKVLHHIWSETVPVAQERKPRIISKDPITMAEAIRRGLREEMERNPRMLLLENNGDQPETGLLGIAQGMAIAGGKPVLEIQSTADSFREFLHVRNEIPTLRWRSNNVWSCPMVVRMPVGGYIHGGPFRSETAEALFTHTPGWRILYPSNAADAKGLIKTACRGDDPVLFLEHQGIQSMSTEPDAEYLIPFGKGRVVREGVDITIVTWGAQVPLSLHAAQRLEEEGISVEIIDLRSLVPYDKELIQRSVRKTGRAIVIHEAPLTGGFGGEVTSFISEYAFESLDAPVRRLGAKDCFVPHAPSLEAAVLPTLDDVTNAIRELSAY